MNRDTTDTINHLRVLPDFDHMHHRGTPTLDHVHGSFIEVLSALECMVVMLNELECRQIRADYLKCLLEAQVERANRHLAELGALI
ncbi:hypothetical protein [Parazoarcus communis]|uniref:Uncharacterized protein n=1 Tax=Parazoarcus communis SWub3 = DSM 12120 TaxID=1121029 RepID=A0A323V896_9RHOO|nr:hypothetical protein [Parazoarcus communis]NMG72290.1 hypothetical protein [Parazoarcus communis SWub3 = DSM 12120]PZA16418.1 hypothetical protein DNK49_12265 [Azoarcus communis] [Parazoarcus communis SWub3 = DSM 12120]